MPRKTPKKSPRKKVQSKPKVWSTDIEKDTTNNKWWREVIYTSRNLQVTLMSVPPKQDLNWEVHPRNDQFFRIEKGKGLLLTKPNQRSRTISEIKLYDGVAAVVPKGVWHNVVNTSNTQDLKVYTIYSPPHHPPKTIDKTHKDEIIRESNRD